MRQTIFAGSSVQAVISDFLAPDACPLPLLTLAETDGNLPPSELETEWLLPTSGTTGIPKLIPHTISSLSKTVRLDHGKGASLRWGTLYDIGRFAGLQVFLQALLGVALACFLLSYVESISVARTFSVKHGYEVNADQELLALGAANVAAGLGQGYPLAGGMSQAAFVAAYGHLAWRWKWPAALAAAVLSNSDDASDSTLAGNACPRLRAQVRCRQRPRHPHRRVGADAAARRSARFGPLRRSVPDHERVLRHRGARRPARARLLWTKQVPGPAVRIRRGRLSRASIHQWQLLAIRRKPGRMACRIQTHQGIADRRRLLRARRG